MNDDLMENFRQLQEQIRAERLRRAAQTLIASRVGGNYYKDRLGETLVLTDAFDALDAALVAMPDKGNNAQ